MSYLYIKKFVDQLRACESRNAREFSISMADAKCLHADITKLLTDAAQSPKTADNSNGTVEKIEISGENF